MSPWQGHSRAPLRVGLAAVAAVDLIVVGANVAMSSPTSLVHPFAPAWLRFLFHRPVAVACIALIGLAALAQFARRRRPGLHGSVALVALAILTEAHAALVGGPMRNFFTSGAMLLGWLLGLACAQQLLEAQEARELPSRDKSALAEQFAEMGAVGALAATYTGAALSKLFTSGMAWVDSTGLRAVILSQHRVGDLSPLGSYARAVAASPALATTLSAATLIVQLGAVVMPFSRRLRIVMGTLILAFHLNAWALLHIFYAEAIALTALFTYPWPHWVRRRVTSPPDVEVSLPRASVVRVLSLFVASLVGIVLVIEVSPLRGYTAMHHREGEGHPQDAMPTSYPPDLHALLGLDEGDEVAGFKVERVGLTPGGSAVIFVARRHEGFALSVVRKGTIDHPAPASTSLYDLYYSRPAPSLAVSQDQIAVVLTALGERIAAREGNVPIPEGM